MSNTENDDFLDKFDNMRIGPPTTPPSTSVGSPGPAPMEVDTTPEASTDYGSGVNVNEVWEMDFLFFFPVFHILLFPTKQLSFYFSHVILSLGFFFL